MSDRKSIGFERDWERFEWRTSSWWNRLSTSSAACLTSSTLAKELASIMALLPPKRAFTSTLRIVNTTTMTNEILKFDWPIIFFESWVCVSDRKIEIKSWNRTPHWILFEMLDFIDGFFSFSSSSFSSSSPTTPREKFDHKRMFRSLNQRLFENHHTHSLHTISLVVCSSKREAVYSTTNVDNL